MIIAILLIIAAAASIWELVQSLHKFNRAYDETARALAEVQLRKETVRFEWIGR